MIEVIKKLQPVIRNKAAEEKQLRRLMRKLRCAYCSMHADAACVQCETKLCKKHVTVIYNRIYCRAHRPDPQ